MRRNSVPTLRATPRAIAGKIKRMLMPKAEPKLDVYFLESAKKDEVAATHSGGLADVFFSPKTHLVHKWLHYLEIYERHFSPYRGRELNFLEIGVFKGGSLEMWRKYFGEKAQICGIDVNPECAAFESPGTKVRIGSQADPEFLKRVVAEVGTPDIILDDGSHVAEHQEVSFRTLFPVLKEGGLYVIEDIHTAYWDRLGGRLSSQGQCHRADQGHDRRHARLVSRPAHDHSAKAEIGAIHVYDSLVGDREEAEGAASAHQDPGNRCSAAFAGSLTGLRYDRRNH
jgi:hypothetical protein